MNSFKKSFSVLACLTSILLLITSCGSGTSTRNLQIPGVDGPRVTLSGDNVIVQMAFENIQFDGGIRYAIPKYKNSFVEVAPDLQSAGTLMTVSVDLDDVFSGNLGVLDPLKLPGGRPLPGVAGGSLPALAFSVEKFKNMAFYIGPDVFGLWVPVNGIKMNGSIITSRFYTDNLRIGNLSIVGEDQYGENSGFLLMLDLKGSIKTQLQKLAKRS